MQSTIVAVLGVLVIGSVGCDPKPEDAKSDTKSETGSKAAGAGSKSSGATDASRKAVQVVAGEGAACARMDDGTVRCWGRNDYGELAVTPAQTDAASPVMIDGVTGSVALAMGGDPGDQGDLVCSIDASAEVTCWGYARLVPVEGAKPGVPTKVPALSGAQALVMGGGTNYALMKDGSVIGWGSTAFDALGDGDTSGRDKGPTKIPGISGATQLAAGQNHACVVTSAGKVSCWGYGKPGPVEIAGLADVKLIAAGSGSSETCAVAGGKVQCWRDDLQPRPVQGLGEVVELAGRTHWCARDAAGAVSCWGGNDRGQLGRGTAGGAEASAVAVSGVADATSIAVGRQTTCAARKDGSVSCWGYNQRGQLGDGTLVDRSSPVAVVGLQAAALSAAVDGTAEVQEATTQMDWAGLPAACKKPEKLAVTSPRLAGADFPVVSAYAQSQGDGKTIKLEVANYRMDPKRRWDPPRGKQARVELRLGKVDLAHERTPMVVDAGTYSMDTKQDRLVYATLATKATSETLATLSLAGVDAGSVEIAHLDGSWVCGTLALRGGKDVAVSGPFAARIVAQ